MANPVGITRANFLSPQELTDGVLHSINAKGGFQEFATIAERNALPVYSNANANAPYNGFSLSDDKWSSGRRRVGMLAHVLDTSTTSSSAGSSWTLENTINVESEASHVAGNGTVLGVASSINNAIMIYRWDGAAWQYDGACACFISDGVAAGTTEYSKSHFAFSADGNTLACISNPNAGDDTTEFGSGSETEIRIYRYQNNAWVLSDTKPRLSNHAGGRYISISQDGNTVAVSALATTSGGDTITADFPARRVAVWSWSGVSWTPKMNPAGYEQGYQARLNHDGSKMLSWVLDPADPNSLNSTGFKVMSWNGSAWVDEQSWSDLFYPRMFSPSGNHFIVGSGTTERVYEWNGSTWSLKGEITTGATGQFSYSITSDASRLLVQEWPNGFDVDPGAVSIWDFANGQYSQTLTAELAHSGQAQSSNDDLTRVWVSNAGETELYEYSLPTNNGTVTDRKSVV